MQKLLIFLLLLVVVFFGAGMFLPSQIHVERSIVINRPAATVFTLLNSYRTFNRWSPWAQQDPGAVFTFSGPDSGVGARMSWVGDPAMTGTGYQEIVSSTPYEHLGIKLDFGAQDTCHTTRE